jgi:hypothetical protein
MAGSLREQDDKLGFTFAKKNEACRLFDEIKTLSSDKDSMSGVKTQYPN